MENTTESFMDLLEVSGPMNLDIILQYPVTIVDGLLKGYGGIVLSFDKELDNVRVQLADNETVTEVPSSWIRQDMEYVSVTCKCGTIYDIKLSDNNGKTVVVTVILISKEEKF